jgi:hypothetical protein
VDIGGGEFESNEACSDKDALGAIESPSDKDGVDPIGLDGSKRSEVPHLLEPRKAELRDGDTLGIGVEAAHGPVGHAKVSKIISKVTTLLVVCQLELPTVEICVIRGRTSE